MGYPQFDNRFKPRMLANGLATQQAPDGEAYSERYGADTQIHESERRWVEAAQRRRTETFAAAGAPSQMGKLSVDAEPKA